MSPIKLQRTNRRIGPFRRARFESLEPRLTLAVDLSFAGAFQALAGPSSSIYNAPHDLFYGGGMVTDQVGNQYITVNGAANHLVDLDPGPAISSVTLDAAVVKLDPSGSLVWKAAFNTSNSPIRINHAVDANQNVYLVGDFRGTVDFDPGPGVVNVTSSQNGSEYSVYFAKLNSAGGLQWVRKIDGAGLSPDRIAVDADGNLVVAAGFYAVGTPTDVDPGPGQVLVQQQPNSTGLLVLKYDANGDFLWVRHFDAVNGVTSGMKSIAVDDLGGVYVAGGFTGNLDLNPGAGVYMVSNSDTGPDAFVVRLDSSGNFVSAYATEGSGSAAFMDIDVADDGSIVASGYLKATVDFAPGSASLPLTSFGDRADALVLKLNSGFSVDWVHRYGGDGETTAAAVEVDSAGNIYLGGAFGRLFDFGPTGLPADFDPGPGVYELIRPSTYETAYALSLTEYGDFRWAVQLGGNTGRAQVEGMSISAGGNVQLSGVFKGSGDFDPDPAAQYTLNSGIVQSVFFATLTQSEPDPGAPTVDAGAPQTIVVNGVANLDGTVTDNGLPNPVTTTWSKISGPGTVAFGNATAVDTTATFSTIGTYLLKLEATDGQFTTADYIQIVVNPLTATLTATADTYIDGGNTTTNYGASASLIVDGKPDDGALLKWDVSSIPAGSTMQSATLSINVTGTSADTYEIYELKRTWTEQQATWKKANSSTNWQSAGAQGALDRGTTVLGTATASATGIKSVALNAAGLAVVQGWVNNPATNFGFILQDYANSTDDDLVFSSKEATVAANRPQLQVVYNPPSAAPLARTSSLSLQAQVVAPTVPPTASPAVAAKPGKSPAAMSRTIATRENADLLAVVLSGNHARESAKHLATATVLDENDHDSHEHHTACVDAVLATLGGQQLSRFAL